jgi:hypothetical protein
MKKRSKKSVKTSPTKDNGYYDVKTFTYYIPAPPKRKSGYREKELDQILYHLLNSGHELIDLKISSTSGESQGTLVVCVLGNKNKKLIGPLLNIQEQIGLDNNSRDTEIEIELD